jgi:putative flippase GtrA
MIVLVVDRYKALKRSALGVRMTRYTLGSLVAAATSAVVFAVLYALGASTNVCSVSAFVAGAVPNWILNRRWAWRLRGRVAVGREVFACIAVAALMRRLTVKNDVPMSAVGDNTLSAKRMRN